MIAEVFTPESVVKTSTITLGAFGVLGDCDHRGTVWPRDFRVHRYDPTTVRTFALPVALGQLRPEWTHGGQPAQHSMQNLGGHPAEGGGVLVTVRAVPQVHLRHGVKSVRPNRVDEQSGLHPVPGREWQRLQQ